MCWVLIFLLCLLPTFGRNAYENCVVLEARICYDVAKLMYLNSERWGCSVFWCICVPSWLQPRADTRTLLTFRKKAERSKKFFIDLQAKEHVTTMVNPKPCGHLCCCVIKGCEQVGDVWRPSGAAAAFTRKGRRVFWAHLVLDYNTTSQCAQALHIPPKRFFSHLNKSKINIHLITTCSKHGASFFFSQKFKAFCGLLLWIHTHQNYHHPSFFSSNSV